MLPKHFILSKSKVIYRIFVYIWIKCKKHYIHYLQSLAKRYANTPIHKIRKRYFLNFIKISCTLIDRCDIKATGSTNVFLPGIRGLKEVLTRFYPLFAQGHTVSTKMFSPNFNSTPHRLTNIFGKIKQSYLLGSTYLVPGSWGLEFQLKLNFTAAPTKPFIIILMFVAFLFSELLHFNFQHNPHTGIGCGYYSLSQCMKK